MPESRGDRDLLRTVAVAVETGLADDAVRQAERHRLVFPA
jgi:hypothetical protein